MAIIIGGIPSETLTGGLAADLIFGLAGNDSLTGNEDGDTLDGGKGADTLVGGVGNDSYVVDNAKDVVTETGGDLDDRVLAPFSVNLGLPAFAGIEHVTLTGLAASAIGDDGANMLVGNAAANKLDGRAGPDTLIGGAGNDIYFVDDMADVAIENSGEGIDTVIVTATVDFKLGANIENLTVASNVASGYEVFGNALANKITGSGAGGSLSGEDGNDLIVGGNGNDGLEGGAGADTLIGGKGFDSYFVDDIGDKVFEAGPAGEFDQIFSTVTYVLGANLEGLFLSGGDDIDGTGNSLNNEMEGNFGNNVVNGLAGNDTLEVGPGKDTLVGGTGSDEFRFTDKNLDGLDVIADFDGLPGGDKLSISTLVGVLSAGTEAKFIQTVVVDGSTIIQLALDGSGAGPDAAVLWGVSTDLDGLLANGSIVDVGTPATPPIDGTAGADNKAGTGVSNLIRGLGGNDTLSGLAGFDTLDGGAGNDSLIGGSESDTYVVNSAGDKIDESGGGTDDRILASIAIDLNNAAYTGIEHVTLIGTAALSAIGNGGANMLIGNAAANKLDGKAGLDTLIGGAGNDIYLVDDLNDVAIENPGGGIDAVISSVSGFALGVSIENLTLAPGVFAGIGNALANVITGNADSNSLDGGSGNDTLIGNDGTDILSGGAGADLMVGGKGGDIYVVNDAGDKIVEKGPAADSDIVNSTISYTLGATLERLQLLVEDDIDGTGNALANAITGNKGENVLRGLAGNDVLNGDFGNDLLVGGDGNDQLTAHAGEDTLVGGAGSDTFHFGQALVLDGVEVVADFNGLPGGDKLNFASLLLSNFALPASDFIQTVTANGSTTIRVDTNGTVGGPGFVDMAVLQGVSTDLDGLLANGSIALDFNPMVPATPPTDGTAGADSKSGTGISDLIRGLAGNDTLTGNAGFDTLDGGAGADSLVGGADSDTYVIDNAKDKIDESGGTDDRILASIAINLTNAAYAGIEHVTLAGVAALSAIGNGGANMLIGNAGANKLDGGLGADTLIGGAGNDTYIVDGTDEIIEYADGGSDLVISSANVTKLGDYVENLTLLAGAFEGSGNSLANKIAGDGASNILHGGGGNDTLTGNNGNDSLEGDAGADLLIGGKGDDRYFVDNIGDKVVESGSAADTDLVLSDISYVLGATIEDLQLLGISNIDGTGNGLGNNINGNDGNNVLRGMAGDDFIDGGFSGLDLLLGGDGNDTLSSAGSQATMVGGSGSDLFQIDGGGIDPVDVIADFNGLPGGDVLLIAGVDYDPMTSKLDDFVRTTTADGNTKISVDGDGALNGVNFVEVAVLRGVSTSAQALMDSGSLDLQGVI